MSGVLPLGRVRVATVTAVVAMMVLFGRLVTLQVADSSGYAAQADSNRARVVATEAPRGRILDRDGRVLAGHRRAWRVGLDRTLSEAKRGMVLRRLAGLLGTPAATLAARLDDPSVPAALPAPVADDVPLDVVVALRERPGQFPGVAVEEYPKRFYPHGSLAAHVLGLVRPDPAGGVDPVGVVGVEAERESLLAGRPGSERIAVDARGAPAGVMARTAPDAGADVILTLDLALQRAAERALADGIAAARVSHPAPAGSVVALDCTSGAVRALASAPTFDPNAFTGRVSPHDWRRLTQGPAAPLVDRATTGLYAPGSTFKPFTALAGLEAGALTASSVVYDRGSYRVGGRVFRNAGGIAYGPVDLGRALTVSSDVYFYALGERLHDAATGGPVPAMARRFGFGSLTGIDVGDEAAGTVPDPSYRRALAERHPARFPDRRWFPGDSVNLAIGQGSLVVTPLQLAVAYSALATAGPLPVPYLLEASPRTRKPGVGAEALSSVRAGLAGVASSPEGTAWSAFGGFAMPAPGLPAPADGSPAAPTVTVLGKTGTAQVTGRADTSLFAGALRHGDACTAVVAVVEEGGFGSEVAAPIVRRVMEALL